MLLPALVSAKERSRRTTCKNSIRQFSLAVTLYGDDNRDYVPTGASEMGPLDDHLPVLCTNTRNAVIEYTRTYRILDCPSLGKPFNQPQGWMPEDGAGYGIVIGYNYHGAHTNTPWPALPVSGSGTWISPQRLTDGPALVLVSDANDWSPGYGKTFAPHGRGGPILSNGDFANESAAGASPAAIGAMGGNIGTLDGAVTWKSIKSMAIYRGSQKWDDSGCWAMW
jgi:hypothetical protein